MGSTNKYVFILFLRKMIINYKARLRLHTQSYFSRPIAKPRESSFALPWNQKETQKHLIQQYCEEVEKNHHRILRFNFKRITSTFNSNIFLSRNSRAQHLFHIIYLPYLWGCMRRLESIEHTV